MQNVIVCETRRGFRASLGRGDPCTQYSARLEIESGGQKFVREQARLMVVDDGYQHHFVDVQDAGDVDERVANMIGRADDRAGPFARLARHYIVGEGAGSQLGERLFGRGNRTAHSAARVTHE